MNKKQIQMSPNSTIAFHGSPHDFGRFSMDHVGNGSGIQTYGWGLYFAAERKAAAYYQRKLGEFYFLIDGKREEEASAFEFLATMKVAENNGDISKAIQTIIEKEGRKPSREALDQIAYLQRLKDIGAEFYSEGFLYAAELPPEEKFLLWDEPLKNQSDAVKRVAKQLKIPTERNQLIKSGAALYAWIAKMKGHFDSEGASLFLREAGVAGIKYVDKNSPIAGDAYNYVVFDDRDVSITEKSDFAKRDVRTSSHLVTKNDLGRQVLVERRKATTETQEPSVVVSL